MQLPFQARELTKHDLSRYEPMFAMYLDIQKGLSIEDLPSDEVRGRWKSFVGKWYVMATGPCPVLIMIMWRKGWIVFVKLTYQEPWRTRRGMV